MTTLESEHTPDHSLSSAGLASRPLPRSHRRASWQQVSLATDAVAISAAAILADLTSGASGWNAAWLLVFVAVAVGLLVNKGVYRRPIDLRVLEAVRSIIVAMAMAAALAFALSVLVTGSALSRQEIVLAWLLATGFVIVGRLAVIASERRARMNGDAGQPTLIVGAGKVGRLVARRLSEHPELGLRPVGFLDKEPLEVGGEAELPVLGASWDLEQIVADRRIEHVIVAFSTAPEEVLLRLLKRCERLGIETSVVPRLYEKSTEHVTVVPLGGLPLIARRVPDPKSWQFTVKHAFDRLGAALVLLLLAPVLAVVAIGVWISLGRPIFYRAERIGRDGRRFDMLKFRSMLPMTDEERNNLVIDAETGTGGNNGLDRRTGFGTFIRRASLDELPQLFNVLAGDMSLVGPRPERSEYVEVYERTVPRYEDRHRVKSGITGWAQVCGLRGKTSLADRAEWDNYYIENWSYWLDIKIFLLTLLAVVRTGEAD